MSETPNGLRGEMAAACFDPGAYVGPRGARTTGQWRADSCIAGPLAPILAQVSALQAEVERLQKERDEAREVVALCNNSFGSYSYHTNPHPAEQIEKVKEQARSEWRRAEEALERLQKVEGERENGRVTSSPGYSSSAEPQSVSALTGEYPSRESVEILHGKIKNARAYADREDFLLSTICPSSEETDILLRALSEYAQAAQGAEARQGRDACGSVHDGPVATASTALKNRSEAT